MLRKYFSRAVKYGVVSGVAIGGTAYAAKYDYNASTLVRITRTAVTAIDIGRTYKTMLYSKDWDTNSSEYLEVKSEAHKISAEKLLELCKANKGAYIKVGQHVGALDYLLPNEYVTTMRVLHKDAPQNSVEELYKVIKEDLNEDPNNLFSEFDTEPLGTASLAQVHRAKLKDGTEVAVKVQHHFVRKNIQIDITWMELVLKAMAKIFPEFQMQWLIDETRKNIMKELDFLQEGRNAEKVAKMFTNYSWLRVPKIFWDYSTERVLVMEYVHGGQVNDVKYIDKHKIDKADLCRKLGDLYSHMIFISGFVHSDPHPGNILVRKDPGAKDVTVFLLDHGLYATLTDKFRYHYSKLWLSIIYRDREEMRVHSEALGIRKELYGLFACMVTGRPWDSIMKGIGRTKPSSEEKTTFQTELPNFLHYVTQCLEHVDRQALLVLKTNDLIRSIEYALHMQDRMCGFLVMSRCCMESAYRQEYKDTSSLWKRQYISLKFAWSVVILYLYAAYLSIIDNVKIPFGKDVKIRLANQNFS
ncbi:aarF domain containing kinase 1 [Choristoneura fumiferana]|uniref:aarF domain containing kinase 1 n=1 Tax=Choristoneura fumiferana TaxID=7141 RepID=UPI003D15DB43